MTAGEDDGRPGDVDDGQPDVMGAYLGRGRIVDGDGRWHEPDANVVDVAAVRRAHHLQLITLVGFLAREEPDLWSEPLVAFVVQVAREDFYGPSWAQIGDALGMSEGAVCERFDACRQLRLA